MNLRKLATLLLCLCLLAPAWALGEGAPVTLTDMMGRTITLDAPATRVVALTASDCEILYALGAGDALVGRGEYCDYPEAALQVQSVESGYETNIEQIIALQPQLVIMNTMAQTKEGVEAMESAGLKVLVNSIKSIDGVYEAITLIGAATGRDEQARALIAGMQADFAEIKQKVPAGGEKTVYFEVSPLQYGLWTAGQSTFLDELATMLGLTNAFADVNEYAEVSAEQVIARDPDIIVTVAMYYGEGATPVEEILSREGWQGMKAVQSKAVFNADGNETSRPGPRLVNAARSLYAFVYGGEAK